MEQLPADKRRNFFCLMAAGGLYMCSVSFTLLLPRYLAHIDATPREIGWLIGLPVPFYAVFTLFTGWLADRIEVRWLSLMGIALSAAASWAMLLLDSVGAWAWILRAAQGTGHAFAMTPIVTMTSRSLDSSTRAQGIGYFTVAVQVGNIVGTLVAALLIERLGFNAYFWTGSAVAAAAAVMLGFVRSSAAAPVRVGGNTVATEEEKSPGRYVHGLVLILVLGGAFGMVLQYAPLMLDHLSAEQLLSAPMSASWILTTLLATVIAVRLLAPRAIYRPGGEPWLTLCMLGAIASLLLFPSIGGVPTAVAVASLLGITYGILFPMVHALCLNRAGPARQGLAVSLTNLTYDCGYRGFGFLMGPVVAAFGYGGMFLALAAITAVGCIAFLSLEPQSQRWLSLGAARDARRAQRSTA